MKAETFFLQFWSLSKYLEAFWIHQKTEIKVFRITCYKRLFSFFCLLFELFHSSQGYVVVELITLRFFNAWKTIPGLSKSEKWNENQGWWVNGFTVMIWRIHCFWNYLLCNSVFRYVVRLYECAVEGWLMISFTRMGERVGFSIPFSLPFISFPFIYTVTRFSFFKTFNGDLM